MDGTILIIDSSEYEREKVKITFDNIGDFEFIEIKNPNEFYNFKEIKSDISLIILDIEFPVAEEGFKILSLLKTKLVADIPVIIVTKADNKNYRKTALDFNVRDYIIKPYRTQRLGDSVRSILKIDQFFKYNINSANVITLSVEDYITKEFKIASRANKKLSIILITPIYAYNKTVLEKNKMTDPEFINNVYNSVIEKVKLSSRYTDTVILNDNKDILVILPFTDALGASKVVEKIKINVSEALNKLNVDFSELFYTVCSTFPDDGKNFQALMKKSVKQAEDKIMLEKITSIGENALDDARSKYNKFKI